MPLPTTSHRLFERTWRSTCPIRPRHSALRRWSGLGLLAVLIALIAGYALITDSDRVREQAETYLQRLVGGPAQVDRATLSLFEGLRLEGVTIRTPGEPLADSVVFTARSLAIDYNPLHLLLGRISATEIIAVDPHLRLIEDTQTGHWNFQRLQRPQRDPSQPRSRLTPPEELPQIYLRNAQVEYARVAGGAILPRGNVGIEAQLRPASAAGSEASSVAEDSSYRFALQTRGLSGAQGAPGPRATGLINLHNAYVRASLQDVDFAALLDILPRAAAEWWRQHDISGRMDVPHIRVDWSDLVEIAGPDGALERVPRFRAVVELHDAQMQGLPEEWLPSEEVAARREVVALLRSLTTRTSNRPLASALARLAEEAEPRPLRLKRVSGSFVFTHASLLVSGLEGDFEGNRLRVDGIVDGYAPDAGLSLVVQNADAFISLPRDVDYIGSLPRQVREIYHRFLPTGRCRMRLELHRAPATIEGRGARPIVTGYVDVLDGMFTLDRFPYPVRNARGRLLLRYDRETQQDLLRIENLRGLGIAGGPNENARITVDGQVGPLTSYAGFDIVVAGADVSHEPALVAALPEAARQTIAKFDPARNGKGAGADAGPPPVLGFAGDFRAHVLRPAGPRQRWDYRVDLDLRDMNGAFAAFPYPLINATGKVSVFPDHVQITDARTSRLIHPAEAALPPVTADVRFGGRVDWGRRPGDPAEISRRPIRVDLSVSGKSVPTDAALVGSLPPEAQGQLAALGIWGTGDFQARVYTDEADELRWDVTLDMADGRFWPETGTFSLSELRGRVRILPERVELTNLSGRRGEGTVTIDGSIELAPDGLVDARLIANDITLDAAVYDMLPPAAQDAWNWLRPTGTTNAQVTYRGPAALLWAHDEPLDPQATLEDAQYEVILHPQGAAALPRAFPYALQNVRGQIRIAPGRVELKDLTADHTLGDNRPGAKLAVSGFGDLGAGEDGADVWQLTPQISQAPLDEALLAALPEGLRKTLDSIKAAGTISAEFSRLLITAHPQTESLVPPATNPAQEQSNLDVEFAVKVTASEASMDVGAPLSNVQGALSLSGKYLRGELEELAGAFVADRFAVRGRVGSQLRGTIALPHGSNTLSIGDVEAQVADGQLGGNIVLSFAEDPTEPARYSVGMSVREADVRKLIGEQPGRAADFSGRMTARLDLEGEFGAPNSRRGRGDVMVEGQKLYDLPLVLGLLQVTNLALPLSEPFREASAGFQLDGQRVIFDHISLRARDMQMTGQGTLDFETQKVDLSFTTSSAGWASIPLVGDLVGVARNELLRINVRGTLKSPEVSGSTLPTVTSTIDEVFRRD